MTKRSERIRTCVLTGESLPAHAMLRFVVDPDGALVPDIGGRLPGRAIWTGVPRERLEEAIGSGDLARRASRSMRRPIAPEAVAADLASSIDSGLEAACLNLMGMARGAGQMAVGLEKVKRALGKGQVHLLVLAADAGADGRRNMARAMAAAPLTPPLVDIFERDRLGRALGRPEVVHAAVVGEGFAGRIGQEVLRLATFRGKGMRDFAPATGGESQAPLAGASVL